MKKPEASYAREGPYVFVSYSHRDEKLIHREIHRLQKNGIKVWYDQGIGAGDEWSETLAAAIADCSVFLFFVTPNSIESEHCRRELTFANERANMVSAIHLQPTDLPIGLQLALGNRQALLKYELSEIDYENKVLKLLNAIEASTSLVQEVVVPREIQSPRPTDDRPGIAILPFRNRSADQDIEFICEGIADEIITALSAVEGVRVISSGSASKVDLQNTGLSEIGRQLNVNYILEGSIQKSGERLRITAKLPSTQSDEILWADRWDGLIDQIFDVQETIALSVLDALQIHLSAAQSAQLIERPIHDIQAYELYLRARQLIKTFTADALHEALAYLRQGEKIIGENTHIIAAMGQVNWQFHNAGIDSDPKYLAEAEQCVERLFNIDPGSADGHRLYGLLKCKETDGIQVAINHLKIALKSNPNDPEALLWLSLLYAFVGEVSTGMSLAEHLLKLDPLTNVHLVLPGFLNMLDGKLVRASQELLHSHEKNPGNPITTVVYGQVLAMLGDTESAILILRSINESVPDSFFSSLGNFYAASLEGDKGLALDNATELLESEARSDVQYSWTLAQCYASIGELEKATDWVDNAIRYGFLNYSLLSEHDPLLKPLRSHERFNTLMADLREKRAVFDA